jgi:hypothetical protein
MFFFPDWQMCHAFKYWYFVGQQIEIFMKNKNIPICAWK